MNKMDYDGVYAVFDSLHYAFNQADATEPDIRCIALWTLFLSSVGWTEEEFWEAYDNRDKLDICPDCGKPMHDDESDDDISTETDIELN